MPESQDHPFPETTIDDVFGCLQSAHQPITDAEIAQTAQDMAAQRYLEFRKENNEVGYQ